MSRRRPPEKKGAGFTLRDDDYYVDEKGCWIWLWYKNKAGYAKAGSLYVTRLLMNAQPGQVVRHGPGCSTSCINPAHLKLGTYSENALDRVIDGNHPLEKTTDDEVREIFRRVWNGEKQKDLAREFGLDQTTISSIKLGKTRAHITDPIGHPHGR